MARARLAGTLSLAAAMVSLCSFRAWGGPPQKEGVLRLGHYSTADGLVGLVLDRTEAKPRFRLDGGDEILVLTPDTTSSRGTVYLKGDDGRNVVGISEYGQTTYYDGSSDGKVLLRDANAEKLVHPAGAAGRPEIDAAIAAAKKGLGAKGLSLSFEIADAADSHALLDAIAATGRALETVGADELGRSEIAKKLKKVVFGKGAPSASISGSTLSVKVAAEKGLEGRLSSAAVAKAVEEGL